MEQIFQFAMHQALEMMLQFDEKGTIVYANDVAMGALEYGSALYGMTISDIFPGEFSITENGFESKVGFGTDVVNMMAYRKNRTCFPVEAKIMKYGVYPGAYICLMQDLSRLQYYEKRANQAGQEIEEALKVKSQFVANVTHELRTPVNGILGNTRELSEIETDPAKTKLLQLVERGCNDMHAIINNILDFSKLEAGKFTLEKRPFNFRDMMDYVKSNHINKIAEKGLEFFMTISPDVPQEIIGDELRIVQILNNLMSNACKFTSVGKITLEAVKTTQIGNRAELFFMVIDSGIGIDAADQDKLFKSFSQVEASTSRKYGGTGLGLNICKQLVELMDGNIRVESQKGKGTMFSFHIWVEVPGVQGEEMVQEYHLEQPVHGLGILEGEQEIWSYGTPENLTEIKKKMSKLILSVEMENWEKAEMFMDTIKQLTEEAPREVKSIVLRLKMAVQKAEYEKTVYAYNKLQALLSE